MAQATAITETTTSRTASRGAERADRADTDVEAYFSALDRESLMDVEQEREVARRIVRLRRDYWVQLLGYPPFIEAMLVVIGGALSERGKTVRSIDKATEAGRVLRGRPRREHKAKAEAVVEAFARQMAQLDPSIEIADQLFADLECAEVGNPREISLDVRRPVRGSVTFGRYLHGVRSARMALCAARHEMVRANLRLVVTMARRYRQSGRLPLADLIQEGNLGLMIAVDRFDPGKGFRFSTYGSWWIRHSIGRALSDKGRAVRLPVHVVGLQHQIAKARREFEATRRRPPERAELAALVGVPEGKLERLERALLQQDNSVGSRDRESGGQGIEVLADEGPDVDSLLHGERLDSALADAMDTLRPMEAAILRHRFGLDDGQTLTLREVGELHGLSRERIRQLQERALEKIRGELRERGFALGRSLVA